MAMRISKLGAQHVDAYRRLRQQGLKEFPPAFGESVDEFAALTADEVATTLEDPAGNRHVFGALNETGELIGIVGMTRDALEKMRHKGYIWGMYVAPGHQGQGIARKLLDAAIVHARGIPGLEQLRLIVGEANVGARKLYESVGFVAFGLEPRELKTSGEYYDSVHMWLKL
jgi:ribosomal protein S18 acetylase RimI-like enzyme